MCKSQSVRILTKISEYVRYVLTSNNVLKVLHFDLVKINIFIFLYIWGPRLHAIIHTSLEKF